MRQTLSRGVFAAAAATGILSLYGTPAFADSHAVGGAEDSPGVLSGNNVQAPVHVPVNVCGNSVNVVGLFNGTAGNTCVNGSHTHKSTSKSEEGSKSSSSPSHGGAHAVGGTEDSPGVLSGNNVQAPVHVPVNVCGNSVDVIGLFNETADNTCVNGSYGHESTSKSEERSSSTSRGGSSYGDSSYGDSSYGGAHAVGGAKGSPGVLSGNSVQLPVDLPVNVCGNSVDVVGVFNHGYGNSCDNHGYGYGYGDDGYGYGDDGYGDGGYGTDEKTPPPVKDKPTPPPTRVHQTPPPTGHEQPGEPPRMAETGSEGVLAASAAAAVLVTGGAMLYRRGRAASHR